MLCLRWLSSARVDTALNRVDALNVINVEVTFLTLATHAPCRTGPAIDCHIVARTTAAIRITRSSQYWRSRRKFAARSHRSARSVESSAYWWHIRSICRTLAQAVEIRPQRHTNTISPPKNRTTCPGRGYRKGDRAPHVGRSSHRSQPQTWARYSEASVGFGGCSAANICRSTCAHDPAGASPSNEKAYGSVPGSIGRGGGCTSGARCSAARMRYVPSH